MKNQNQKNYSPKNSRNVSNKSDTKFSNSNGYIKNSSRANKNQKYRNDIRTYSSYQKDNIQNKIINEHYKQNKSNNKYSNRDNIEDIIWGKHSTYEVLIGEKPVNRIWVTAELFSSEKFYLKLKEFKKNGVLVEEVSWSRLSQITYGGVHQGIALQVAHSKSILLEELIDISKKKSTNPIIVCLDGITDPHNVGAIIRSSEAFGCSGIVIPQRRSAGITGTVAKVAAGALEHIMVSRVVNLNRSLEELKNEGFLIVGLTGDGNIEISDFKENSPLVIVIGSESKGLSLLTKKNCDYLLNIPLSGKTKSLNASVAAGVSIFQLSKK
tara:strand:- start:882 stop:1856 length:975 start_codon:yes stop_codon:yes gene_type:complete